MEIFVLLFWLFFVVRPFVLTVVSVMMRMNKWDVLDAVTFKWEIAEEITIRVNYKLAIQRRRQGTQTEVEAFLTALIDDGEVLCEVEELEVIDATPLKYYRLVDKKQNRPGRPGPRSPLTVLFPKPAKQTFTQGAIQQNRALFLFNKKIYNI